MDLGNKIATTLTLIPQTTTAGTVYGTGISRKWFEGCVYVGMLGKITGTPDATTVTYQLQESDALASGYTDITDYYCVVTTTGTRKEVNLPMQNLKEYIRPSAVVAFSGGTTPYASISGLLIYGGSKEYPV